MTNNALQQQLTADDWADLDSAIRGRRAPPLMPATTASATAGARVADAVAKLQTPEPTAPTGARYKEALRSPDATLAAPSPEPATLQGQMAELARMVTEIHRRIVGDG